MRIHDAGLTPLDYRHFYDFMKSENEISLCLLSNPIQEGAKHFIICLDRLEIGLVSRWRRYPIGDCFLIAN